jgi:hypothetical protein
MLYVVNRKSPPGANPMACGPNFAADRKAPRACSSANQYIFQLEKAGLLSFPLPDPAALGELTQQTGRNIGLMRGTESAKALETMAALRSKIKHVIFIIKENRTYDQVLGDLEIGNGDPKLAILGEALTPNHHDLARKFVTFDNFHDSGEQSSTGWTWSTAARVTDILEKTAPVNYAGRGLSYEGEGTDRNVKCSVSCSYGADGDGHGSLARSMGSCGPQCLVRGFTRYPASRSGPNFPQSKELCLDFVISRAACRPPASFARRSHKCVKS